MAAQSQPIDHTEIPADLDARLAALGVVVSPSTAEGRRALLSREPLCVPGVSLSETVVRMRDEEREDA